MPVVFLEIERAIRSEVERSSEVRRESRHFGQEVVNHAKGETPVRTGKARAAWHLEERPDVRNLPRWAAVNNDPKINMIENGTGPDTKPGSPFGPDTPTPEFAPAAKTAFFYGGTAP